MNAPISHPLPWWRRLPRHLHEHPWHGWVGGYLLTLVLLLPHAYHGINIWDEGGFPHAALRVLDGDVLYRDFFSQTPFFVHLFAVVFAVVESSLFVARTVWLLVTPFIPLMWFAVGRRIMPLPYAVAGAAVVTLAPGVVFNREVPLAILLNLVLVCRMVEVPSKGRVFLAATSAGATSMLRWDVSGFAGIVGLGIVVAMLVRDRWLHRDNIDREPVGMVHIGAAFAGAVAGGAYYLIGWLVSPRFRYNIFEVFHQLSQNAYAEQAVPFPSLFDEHAWNRAGQALQRAWAGIVTQHPDEVRRAIFSYDFFDLVDIFVLYLPVPLYLVAFATLLFRRDVPFLSAKWIQVAAVVALGLFTFNQAYWRSGLGNLFRVIMPAYLVAFYLLGRVGMRLARWQAHRTQRVYRAALGVAAALWTTFLVGHPLPYELGSPGVLLKDMVFYDHPRIGLWIPPGTREQLETVQRVADEHTSPGDPIFVAPLAPLYYFQTGRRNPTFYEWLMPWWWKGAFTPREQLEQRIIEVLNASGTDLIFMNDIPLANAPTSALSGHAPNLYRWVTENFVEVDSNLYTAYVRETVSTRLRLAADEAAMRITRMQGRIDTFGMGEGEGRTPTIAMSIPAEMQFRIHDLGATHLIGHVLPFQSLDLKEGVVADVVVAVQVGGQTQELWREAVAFYPNAPHEALQVSVQIPQFAGQGVLVLRTELVEGPSTPMTSIGWQDPLLIAK